MANAINALCDAVVASLNAGSFSQSFTAVRSYVPSHALSDLSTLRVTVSPDSSDSQRASRRSGHYRYDLAVMLVVQKAVDVSSNAAPDAIADVVQQIHDHLFANALMSGMQLVSIAQDATVSESEYMHESVFQAVLVCTYRQVRSST